ncbi:MAG: lysophospholipid acyltransferase family protein [Phycisphaerales bacterium JB061]
MTPAIAPARHSDRFLRVFGWYSCRLLRKRFASVRIADNTDALIRESAETDRPVVVAMNHPSWWDPIVGVAIKHLYMRGRFAISPIDMAMYERFGFMKRLGLFGIDLDHPDAGQAMLDYIRSCAQKNPELALFITPQGRFSDVRAPIVVRPGIASAAMSLSDPAVLSLSIEIAFWHDQRPELLLRAERCAQPEQQTTANWVRAVRDCMQRNTDRLTELSVARDADCLKPILVRKGSTINPAFDLAQRARGQSAAVTPRNQSRTEASS